MRRITIVGVVVALGLVSLALIGASIASAAKPDRGPLVTEPTVLGPGQACAFDVEISTVPGSNFTETFFSNRYVITGIGRRPGAATPEWACGDTADIGEDHGERPTQR